MEKSKLMRHAIVIVIIFLAAIVIGATTFGSPFLGDINMIDEGQFGAWANHMLHGKYMYKDIYITYGPFLVYPLYYFFKIFGPSAFLTRFYLSLGGAIGIIIIYLLTLKLNLSVFTRFATVFLFFLLPAISLRQGSGLLVVLLLICVNNKSSVWHFFTGISAGVSFLVSPDIGLFSFVIISISLIDEFISCRKIEQPFYRLFNYLFGIISVFLPFAFWAKNEGWLASYLNVTNDVVFMFSGINVPNGQNFPNALTIMPPGLNLSDWIKYFFSKEILLYWGVIFYISTFIYLSVNFFLKKTDQKYRNLLAVAIFGILLYAVLFTRSGIGHFYFVLPPIFLIGSFYIQELYFLFRKEMNPIGKVFAFFGLLILLIFALRLIFINKSQIKNIVKIIPAVFSAKSNPSRVGQMIISSSQKKDIEDLQNFFARNPTKEDRVFFLTDQPMMYLLTDTVNPTRFDLPFIANTIEKRYEIIDSLLRNNPKYIIEDLRGWAVDGIPNRQRLPEVMSYINDKYSKFSLEGGRFLVYRRLQNNEK